MTEERAAWSRAGTERFSPAGHFPEEGSPVSPQGQRKLVSPWDHRASSSALYGSCQEEMFILHHRNPLLPHSTAPTHMVPTGTDSSCTVKETLAPPAHWPGELTGRVLICYPLIITQNKELFQTPLIPFRAGKHSAQTHLSMGMQGHLESSDQNPSALLSRHWPGVKDVLAHPLPWLKVCIPQRGLFCSVLGSGRFLPSH